MEHRLPCDPGGIQTPDFQNRNLTFYSAELRGLTGCARECECEFASPAKASAKAGV
jgi:hypothetical protein